MEAWLQRLLSWAQQVQAIALLHSAGQAMLIYTAFMLAALLFERRAGADMARYRSRHFFNDVLYTLFYKGGFYNVLLLAVLTNALGAHLDFLKLDLLRGLPWYLGLAIFWVGGDFLMYWWHRLQHANRFMWALHSVHHSQQRLNLFTASRRHPVEDLMLDVFVFFVPFHMLLGIPTKGWLPLAAVITCIAAIQHAELGWGYGLLHRIIVSPRFHAFHHSAEPAHANSNYGFLLSTWDYLFGTAAVSAQARPTRFGVDGIDYRESLLSQLLTPFRLMWRWRRHPLSSPGTSELLQPRDAPAAPTLQLHERALAAAELLRRTGGEIESTVRGRSMGATLTAGTRIRIICRADAAFPVGMVVAFLAGGTLIGHRVVGHGRDQRGRDILLTRGDGSLFCDPVIDPASVVGEVSAWQSGTEWHAIPPAPRRGLLASWTAGFVLVCVRTLAQLSRPVTSIVHEYLLMATMRTRGRLSRLLDTHG